jgi:hypothetical protein
MSSLLASASSEAAVALIDARVVKSTKRQYQNKLKVISEFYDSTYGHPLTVPVELETIKAFFGWLTDIRHADKPLAFSTARQYKSALVWYYQEQNLVLEPVVNQGIESTLNGYKRKVSDYKLAGKMPVFEGKHHLTYDGYRKLAEALFTAQPFARTLFGWPYLVLQWNLIARTATVSAMMMEHVSWEGDALLISTPKHKGDQEGVKCFSRHLYANPSSPIICPVLALAVLTFTRVLRHDPDASSQSLPNFRIFEGSHNEARWSEVLSRTITALPEEDVRMLGAEKKQLGTHSIRKGAATHCAGMVNGPSTVQVFLRAGWSLGNVQDRYLFAGAGGDQVTGRVLCGLPFNDSSFAALPPHFAPGALDELQWPRVLPLYSQMPETFKRALPFLLASVCHHEQWLKDALPPHHPLFATYLFTSGAVATLKPHVLAGCNRCPVTGLTATGLPTHLAISNELTRVVKQTQLLKEALLSKCAELPSELANVLLSKFSINGAIPVTQDDIKALLTNAFNQMRSELRTALPSRPPAAVSLAHPAADSRFHLWLWPDGSMRMVKPGWRFPSADLKATWNLWHYGDVGEHVRPLRHLQKVDLIESQAPLWSKTTGVMKLIAETMVEMKVAQSQREVERLPQDVSAEAFDRAIVRLVERVRAGSTRSKRRWTEMAVATLYGLVKPIRKRKREEEKMEREEREKERKKQREAERQQRRGNGADAAAAGGGVEQLLAAAAAELPEQKDAERE